MLDLLLSGVGEPEPSEQLVGPPLGVAPRHPVQPAEEHEVLPAAEDLVDRRRLAAEADPPPHLVRLGRGVPPGDPGVARVVAQQRRERPHSRRLSRAVRAEQPEHRAAFHLQVEPVQGRLFAVRLTRPSALIVATIWLSLLTV